MATEVKQRNNKAIAMIGIVIAAAAFIASIVISKSSSSNSSTSGPSASVATTNVLVANTLIPKGTKITADMVTNRDLSSAPDGAFKDGSTVIGQYATIAIPANTPIVPQLLVADATTATTAAITVQPLDIAAGNVAMAIPVGGAGPGSSPDLVGVGNFIHDDDHIDMLIDPGSGTVRYGFQDIRVLHAGTYGSAAGVAPTVLVVEVPRAVAEQLTFLVGQQGTDKVVKFVLRPRAEYGKTTMSQYEDAVPPPATPKKDTVVSQSTLDQLFPPR